MPRDSHSHAHRVAAYPAHAPKRQHGDADSHRRRGSAHHTDQHSEHHAMTNGNGNGHGLNGDSSYDHSHDSYDLTSDPDTSGSVGEPSSPRRPQRSATQMAGEDLYIRLNDRDDFWAELEALLELPEGCDLVMLDNTIRMFVTICGAYHGTYPGSLQKWGGRATSILLPQFLNTGG